MSGKDWAALFHNIENKKDLCNLFVNFIRKSYFRDISDYQSNNEAADTRMVLHVLYKNSNPVDSF